MRTVNEACKTILRKNAYPKTDTLADIKHVLTFTDPVLVIRNRQIVLSTLSLTESICSSQNLKFGSCEASMFEAVVADINVELSGKSFVYTIVINDIYTITMGTFKVATFLKQAEKRRRKIVAYNNLLKYNVDVSAWYNSLDFTDLTLAEFRASLNTHLGITAETQTLINDSMIVTKTLEPTTLSAVKVLSAIAEINGTFGQMTSLNTSKFVTLGSATESLGKTRVQYGEYAVHGIDSVFISTDTDEVSATVGATQLNTYNITDNFLVYDKSTSELVIIATNLLSVIDGLEYKPCTITNLGLPYVEAGDAISFSDGTDTFTSYVLKRVLKGTQALTDSYSATGDEYLPQDNTTDKQVAKLTSETSAIVKAYKAYNTYAYEFEGAKYNQRALISETYGSINAKRSRRGRTAENPNSDQAVPDPTDTSISDMFTYDTENRYEQSGSVINYEAPLTNADAGEGVISFGPGRIKRWDGTNLSFGNYAQIRFSASRANPYVRITNGTGSALAPLKCSEIIFPADTEYTTAKARNIKVVALADSPVDGAAATEPNGTLIFVEEA